MGTEVRKDSEYESVENDGIKDMLSLHILLLIYDCNDAQESKSHLYVKHVLSSLFYHFYDHHLCFY